MFAKPIIILASIILLSAETCNNGKDKQLPACIQQMIIAFKEKPLQNPPASIYQYDYQGKKVYYVAAPCCDQMNILYDDQCNVMCHPDGGITGNGDNKCADFNAEKKNEQLIWKDERSGK